MKNVKKVILIMLSSVLFVGCSNDYGRQYDNNEFISGNNVCNCDNTSQNVSDDGRTLTFSAGKLSGIRSLRSADLKEECEDEIFVYMKINKGRGKLVLVKSDHDVVMLKELVHGKTNEYEGNVKFNCGVGKNTLKIVGDNFSGEVKLVQNDKVIFQQEEKLFEDGFPFGSERGGKLFEDDFPFGSERDGALFDNDSLFGSKEDEENSVG